MEIVICAIAKYENNYIREWVDYHLDIGFSKIYIYDNNNIGEEKIADVIDEKTYQNKINIIDVRGHQFVQKKVYNNFYKSYKFDWCAFIDIDEFISFSEKTKYKNIREFILDKQNFEAIHLNWMCYGDNGESRKKSNEVVSRFKEPVLPLNFKYTYLFPENNHIKSIIRSGLDINWEYNGDEWSSNPHTPYGLQNIVNAKGDKINNNSPFQPYSFEVLYIKHYFTKTIEEYAIKIRRQCADTEAEFYSYSKFYRANKLTLKKIIVQNRQNSKELNRNSLRQCFHEYIKYYIVINRLPYFSFLFKSLRKQIWKNYP